MKKQNYSGRNIVNFIDSLYNTADSLHEKHNFNDRKNDLSKLSKMVAFDKLRFLLCQEYLSVSIPENSTLHIAYIKNQVNEELKALYLYKLIDTIINANAIFTEQETEKVHVIHLHDGAFIHNLKKQFLQELNVTNQAI